MHAHLHGLLKGGLTNLCSARLLLYIVFVLAPLIRMPILAIVQGVKDISFSNDGRKFLSTSYDKVVKLWDTETGQVCSSYAPIMFFSFHPVM